MTTEGVSHVVVKVISHILLIVPRGTFLMNENSFRRFNFKTNDCHCEREQRAKQSVRYSQSLLSNEADC